MSDFDPPSLQPLPSPPPPPPPPRSDTAQWQAPPAGYVPYTGNAPLRNTRGLGRTTMVLYWCAVGSVALSVAAILHRKSVVDDIINGRIVTDNPGALDDRARSLIGVAVVVQLVVMIAAAVVTAVWSRRIVANAQSSGVHGLSKNQATFGWLPFAWWGVGFGQLRQALEGLRRETKAVTWWQSAFIVTSLFSFSTRNVGRTAQTASDLSNNLSTASWLTVASGGLLALAAFMGSRAINALDAAFSPA